MPSITLYFGIMTHSSPSIRLCSHNIQPFVYVCPRIKKKKKKPDKFHIVFMLCTISFMYMCRHCKSVKISRCICSSTCTHCLSFLSYSHSFSLSYRFHKRPDSFKGRITERITILQWSHSLRNTKQKKKVFGSNQSHKYKTPARGRMEKTSPKLLWWGGAGNGKEKSMPISAQNA